MLSIDYPMRLGRRVDPNEFSDIAFGEVSFQPAAGWTLLSSAPLRHDGTESLGWVELVDEAVSVSVRTRRFDGSPDDLLDEIVGVADIDGSPAGSAAERRPVIGRSGVRGVVEYRTGSGEEYVCAAYVVCLDPVGPGGIGVEFVAEGYDGALAERVAVVHGMISSIGR